MNATSSKPFVNTFWFGFIGAALGLIASFYLFGLIWTTWNDVDMKYWINNAFLNTSIYRVKILTGSAVLDIGAFFWLYSKGYDQACKGILSVMILLVLTILFFFMD